jgi:carotenoid cleavage dioxygenase-like enzyme
MEATSLDRARAWNAALLAHPGDLDRAIPADRIDGVIPEALRGGRLLVNGPGWTRIGDRTAHPFDGHGYVRALRFDRAGGAHLRGRFVQTPAYREELVAQRIVRRGLATNVDGRFYANLRTKERNVANTTIVPWAGKLLAGWEGGAPYALDAESLATIGEETFSGALMGQQTLAHMRLDAGAERLVLCSMRTRRETTVTFRELDSSGVVQRTRELTLPGPMFAHDFMITEHHYVLAANPLRLKPAALARALLGGGTFLEGIAADDRAAGALHLIPRAAGAVRTVTLPGSAFVVHFGNAFEDGEGIHVDACLFSTFSFGAEFGYRGPHASLDPALPDARAPQRLRRIRVPLGATSATWEDLAPYGVDFPRVHPLHEGRCTPWLVAASRRDRNHSDPFDALLLVDLLDRERPPVLWSCPEHTFVGEPLLAPVEGGAGYVLSLLSQPLQERSTLLIFSIDRLAEGPICQIPLPLLPYGFHGTWQTARRLSEDVE